MTFTVSIDVSHDDPAEAHAIALSLCDALNRTACLERGSWRSDILSITDPRIAHVVGKDVSRAVAEAREGFRNVEPPLPLPVYMRDRSLGEAEQGIKAL